MKDILRAIAAFLSALPTLVWTTIMIGGRLVKRLMPGPDPMPRRSTASGSGQAEALEVDQRAPAVGEIAQAFLRGDVADAEVLALAGDRAFRWLVAMDLPMKQIVATASENSLRDHLRGKRSIRGLLAFDERAVEGWERRQAMGDEVEDDLDADLRVDLAAAR